MQETFERQKMLKMIYLEYLTDRTSTPCDAKLVKRRRRRQGRLSVFLMSRRWSVELSSETNFRRHLHTLVQIQLFRRISLIGATAIYEVVLGGAGGKVDKFGVSKMVKMMVVVVVAELMVWVDDVMSRKISAETDTSVPNSRRLWLVNAESARRKWGRALAFSGDLDVWEFWNFFFGARRWRRNENDRSKFPPLRRSRFCSSLAIRRFAVDAADAESWENVVDVVGRAQGRVFSIVVVVVVVFSVLLRLFFRLFRQLQRLLHLRRLSWIVRLNLRHRKRFSTGNRNRRIRFIRHGLLTSRPQCERKLFVAFVVLSHRGRKFWIVRLRVSKVRMFEGFLSSASPGGVPRQKSVKKGNGSSRRSGTENLKFKQNKLSG